MWLKGPTSFQDQCYFLRNSTADKQCAIFLLLLLLLCLDLKVETPGFQAFICSASVTPQGGEVNGFKYCLNSEDILDKHTCVTPIHIWVRCKCCLNRDWSLFHSPPYLSPTHVHIFPYVFRIEKKGLRRRGSVGLSLETREPICLCVPLKLN